MEDLNVPVVALVNKNFAIDAKSAVTNSEMPGIRIVLETVPCECTVMEEIEVAVDAVMDDIVAALTKPLTEEEKSPKAKEIERLPWIVFKGDLEEVNRFFYKRGWTDGLPIIPPTEEAVKEMLTGTNLATDYVVGKIVPRLGKATVEKIAINAVMAGVLPTYMPVLIAAVQALVDPKSHFSTHAVSTGSCVPFWIVNGPVRNDLNINSGSGALSPGDIANATTGRALGLIVKNIGGVRKGVEDMGVIGNPGKYTMVVAENEEESPFEPLHVEHGLSKDDSAVSVFFPNCFTQVQSYGTDVNGILSAVVYNIMPGQKGLFCLILPPVHAKTLVGKGWTKKEVAAFISENAQVPAYRDTPTRFTAHRKEYWPMQPTDSKPILRNPDWIRTLVAGGPGSFMGLLAGTCPPGHGWVTKKVELPANWGKLVEKYKDVVPTYVLY